MPNQTPLFVRSQPGGMFSIVDVTRHAGSIFFVDSENSAAADSPGAGQNPDAPFATIDYAVGQCIANNGDTIYVMPGHAETKSVTGSLLAIDVAGLTIVGLGDGAIRPTLTLSHTGATMTISAASITLENIVIVAGIDSVAAPLTISAADFTLRRIEWRDTTNVEFVRALITTAPADRGVIEDCFYNGYTSGNACVNAFRFVGCDSLVIRDCRFHGLFSTAVIEFLTTACTKVVVDACSFLNTGTALTKDIVDTQGASTWQAVNCYDSIGGYSFSGGNAAALASDDAGALSAAIVIIDEFHDVPAANNVLNAQINEVIGNKTDATAAGAVTATDTLVGYAKQLVNVGLTVEQTIAKVQTTPSGGADALFTITGGPIHVKSIVGVVTTILTGTANGSLRATVTTPAGNVNLSSTVAIDDDAAGTIYTFLGPTSVLTPTTAGASVLDVGHATLAPAQFVVPIGNINFLTSGAMTGVITWYMSYIPLSPLSTVVAA